MINVLITEPIHRDGVELLSSKGFNVRYLPDIPKDELLAIIEGYEALIVRGRTKVDKEVIERAERLRIIVRAGVGLDNIDLEIANERGIIVRNTPSAPSRAVAELTVGLILSVLRGIPHGDLSMKQGEWIKRRLIGGELYGRIVGIIGFGRIGREVAKLVKCFGAKVLAYDVIDISESARELGVNVAESLEELLSKSDIVSIHVPLTPKTHHMINEEKLKLMKKGSILVNTSRGAVVNTRALLKALREGWISGAALDVLEHEPPREPWEKELVSLSNVVVTPHIGAQTVEAQRRASIEAAEIIIEFFEGKG